jgi:DNA topoisomerase III
MAGQKILCVAEKPAIAKAVAQHLAGGRVNTVSQRKFLQHGIASNVSQRAIRGNPYVKNYEFDFNFQPWGPCSVTMTSVLGHLTQLDFDKKYKVWSSCPPGQLFDAETEIRIDEDKKAIADNIQQQARYAKILFIWTDCDREGEHIGGEVRDQAKKGNRGIEVKRAKFSNTERA